MVTDVRIFIENLEIAVVRIMQYKSGQNSPEWLARDVGREGSKIGVEEHVGDVRF